MSAMDFKPNGAKVTNLSTRFETLPVDTDKGPVLWADVRIEYILAGLTPTVDIRVPVPFEAGQTEAERKSLALRHARLLIDHACQAAGVPPDKPVSALVQDAIEGIIPPALQGVAQELGIAPPTTKPTPIAPDKG
jgi:hypothetical protein